MTGALHGEWTKLRTVAGTARLLLATVLLTVGLGAAAAAATSCTVPGCAVDTTRLSLTGIQLGQATVAVLAVLVMAGEYGSGMIHTSLLAVPRRSFVLAAKAVAVAGVVAAAGSVAVLGSLLAARLLLPGQDHGVPPLSLTAGSTLRAAAGSVLYLVLIGLLALGVATMVRNSSSAIGIVLALLYFFPILAAVVQSPVWHDRLQRVGPMTAGLAVQTTLGRDAPPIGPWAGLGVLALWAVAALTLGGLVMRFRDA